MRSCLIALFLGLYFTAIGQNTICCENFALIGDENTNQVRKIVSSDGFTYLSGSTRVNNQNFGTFIKVDADNTIVWQYILDDESLLVDFIETDDDAFFILGRTEPVSPPSNNKSILIKIDKDGQVQFINSYENDAREFFISIMKHPNPVSAAAPYYILASNNTSSNPSFFDENVLYNLDVNGNIMWSTVYSHTADDQINLANRPRMNGNILAVGDVGQGNFGVMMELDGGNGAVIRSFQTSAVIKFTDLIDLNDGRYILSGVKTPNDPSGSLLALLDSNWNIIHSIDLDNPNVNNVRRIVDDGQGSYFVTGNLADGRPVVIKFTIDNNLIQIETAKTQLGDQTLEIFPVLSNTGSDLFYAAALVGYENGFGNSDIFFGKLDFDINNSCFQDTTIGGIGAGFDLNTVSISWADYTTPIPEQELAFVDLNYQTTVNCINEMEICDNDIDDDNDGLVDCDDPDLLDSCCCFIPVELDLGIDIDICAEEIVTIGTMEAYDSYQWSTSEQSASIDVTIADTYALTVTDKCGNVFTDEIEVSVVELMEESLSLNACEGDSVVINDISYTVEGMYEQEFVSVSGCDSILLIDLLFLDSTEGAETFSICEGDSINLNGVSYGSQGTFEQLLTNVSGCDSTLFVEISLLESSTGMVEFSICEGEIVVVNGESYTTAGMYEQILENAVGCDSVLNVTILTIDVVTTNLETTICAGEPVLIAGQEFDAPGNYTVNLTGVNGCDSLVFIDILDAGCVECDFLDDGMLIDIDITKRSNHFDVKILEEVRSFTFLELETLLVNLSDWEKTPENFIDEKQSLTSQHLSEMLTLLKKERLAHAENRNDIAPNSNLLILEQLRVGASFHIRYKGL